MSERLIEKIEMPNGQVSVEKKVHELIDADSGEKRVVSELNIDGLERPVSYKVTEKLREEVYERVTEEASDSGKVNRKIESVDFPPLKVRSQGVEANIHGGLINPSERGLQAQLAYKHEGNESAGWESWLTTGLIIIIVAQVALGLYMWFG
jgi:hypothetical protein